MGRVSSFLCVQALLVSLSALSEATPAQIVIVPNAEQSGSGLSLTGQERAQALAPYLSQTPSLIVPGVYQSIFAARPNLSNASLASTETLAPLGFTLGLPVHSPYGVGQEALLAALILNDQRYGGTNVMIAWQSSAVPALLSALGYNYTGGGVANNVTFVLPYPIVSPNITGTAQNLLYGD